MNGFINFFKPSDMSSAYALNLIKKRFKGQKLGHMGTLDPLASGVLPVAFGKSTRLFDYLLDKIKVYRAVFTFGYETDTLDRGGVVIKESKIIPSKEEILSKIDGLVGSILQMPPKYSAKNVGGKRGYELARKGVEFELKPKRVEILKIELTKRVSENSYEFLIECKGGTYIRSICRDLAYSLSTYATMTSLEREKSGCFTKDNAFSLEDIVNNFDEEKMLILPDKVVDLPILNLTDTEEGHLINGRKFLINSQNGKYKVYSKNGFIGIGDVLDNKLNLTAYLKD